MLHPCSVSRNKPLLVNVCHKAFENSSSVLTVLGGDTFSTEKILEAEMSYRASAAWTISLMVISAL